MRSVSFLFVNAKRVSSTLILFEQFMRRYVKKVGEIIKDQMENFNQEERDTLSIPVPAQLQFFMLDHICMLICAI